MNKNLACVVQRNFLKAAFLAAGVALLAGACGNRVVILTEGVGENGYLRAEHPFTDAAEAELKQRSERLCAARKQAAIKTESACSLSKCITTYQCSDQPELMKK